MLDREIIQLWKSGLSKNQLAKVYKTRYNHGIRIIRSEMKNRHAGRYISSYDALAYVEKTILRHLQIEQRKITK